VNRPDILTFLVVAGAPRGDRLAAELVTALRAEPRLQALPFGPRFFGAGGPRMAEAGIEIGIDLTQHAVVGLAEVVRNGLKFLRLLRDLQDLACTRQPNAIICVDFSGFNRRFGRALRRRLRARARLFANWRPRLIQYVSPQVWASRPGRADSLAEDFDLLVCLFPFEREWYARRTPHLRVAAVGHPLQDRYPAASLESKPDSGAMAPARPAVVLLPGSRRGELERHLPVLLAAADRIRARVEARFILVLPDGDLRPLARMLGAGLHPDLAVQVGGLAGALAGASVALAATGTVTLECAWFGVPTVALYRTSWPTYLVARHVITVPYLAMPNLLLNEALFPEFIQREATPDNLARAALRYLESPAESARVRQRLLDLRAQLGGPGASARAASAIAGLLFESAPAPACSRP
jgi:lipid-A-disaccharide synthase